MVGAEHRESLFPEDTTLQQRQSDIPAFLGKGGRGGETRRVAGEGRWSADLRPGLSSLAQKKPCFP